MGFFRNSRGGNADLHFMMTFIIITVMLTACALQSFHRRGDNEQTTREEDPRAGAAIQNGGYWGPKIGRNGPHYDHASTDNISIINLPKF